MAVEKRKRVGGEEKANKKIARDDESRILLLEERILQSGDHLKDIEELQKLLPSTLAAISLCRVFCRLISNDRLIKRSPDDEEFKWLNTQLQTYVKTLSQWLSGPDQTAAVTLLMRIVCAETSQPGKRSDHAWRTKTFHALLSALLTTPSASNARIDFAEKYVDKYTDVQFYTFLAIPALPKIPPTHAIELLTSTPSPSNPSRPPTWFGSTPNPNNKTHHPKNLTKIAQAAWLSIFRSNPPVQTHKSILKSTPTHLLPWFSSRPELLSDFLTTTFSTGGSAALLALQSIYTLITTHNLDYPDLYTHLYSLLDEGVLHSKHRGQFLTFLEKVMMSTHLPVGIVASFAKRLGRLALMAPPGAAVWIVPFVYNLIKKHPRLGFLLHRARHAAHLIWQGEGFREDPFLPEERDVMKTRAIESSLWELWALRAHWHPNVATLVSVLGQQFTKQEFRVGDFGGVGYQSLVEGELAREVRREVAVEGVIPKRIVTAEEGGGLNELGGLLKEAMEVI
ncbi:CBF-domain-containing protein [Piedraia hortae CBS 480.64]|uniref:CBF-domain-containing protein n=1 Tax=Piedraia hortae CBS 480.64 TaxID=1314780 RepID=A0A6A7BRL4_9PEZI|nr:CBF-domain-containing protein [Piedraia hortae CBS 480.64]